MKRFIRAVPAVALLALLAVGAAGCNKLKARDQLNQGVQAYKNGRYEQAIDHFQNATNLDPSLGVAKLYLATAYVGQYIPGVDTPENNKNAQMAIQEYQNVLDENPGRQNKITALKGIASLYFNMKDFENAKKYHLKVLQEDPSDAEADYSIGVIDWTQAYQKDQAARTALGIKGDDPIKDKKACSDLQQANQEVIRDGMDKLNQAMKLRADYNDAMAYMNLLYRQQADIECGDDVARQMDLKTADDWVEKAKVVMKAKAEQQGKQAGIVMDQNQQ